MTTFNWQKGGIETKFVTLHAIKKSITIHEQCNSDKNYDMQIKT
jgi:predicted nucleic acid binding AN1-type Zn finger protein